MKSKVNFDGEFGDIVSGSYHLGTGYHRSYAPVIGRFQCPDSWSPFGPGGLNTYTFCQGDPLNRADPSGHLSWQGIMGIATGIVGLALIPWTLGQSLTLSACIVTGVDMVAGVTAVASGVLDNKVPTASSTLSWISFALGCISLGVGLYSGIRALSGPLGKGLQFLNKLQRGERGGIGIALSGEFRNARFLGYNGNGWNLTYDDSTIMGRRLNVIMGSRWNGSSLRATNHYFLNSNAVTFAPRPLRMFLEDNLGHNLLDYQVLRLIIRDSGLRRNLTHPFGSRFYTIMDYMRPVVSVRGCWWGRGRVAEELHRLQLMGITNRANAQHALNELSLQYGEASGGILFDTDNPADVRVHPHALWTTLDSFID